MLAIALIGIGISGYIHSHPKAPPAQQGPTTYRSDRITAEYSFANGSLELQAVWVPVSMATNKDIAGILTNRIVKKVRF